MVPDIRGQALLNFLARRKKRPVHGVRKPTEVLPIQTKAPVDVRRELPLGERREEAIERVSGGRTADGPISAGRVTEPRIAPEVPLQKILESAVANDPIGVPDQQ